METTTTEPTSVQIVARNWQAPKIPLSVPHYVELRGLDDIARKGSGGIEYRVWVAASKNDPAAVQLAGFDPTSEAVKAKLDSPSFVKLVNHASVSVYVWEPRIQLSHSSGTDQHNPAITVALLQDAIELHTALENAEANDNA